MNNLILIKFIFIFVYNFCFCYGIYNYQCKIEYTLLSITCEANNNEEINVTAEVLEASNSRKQFEWESIEVINLIDENIPDFYLSRGIYFSSVSIRNMINLKSIENNAFNMTKSMRGFHITGKNKLSYIPGHDLYRALRQHNLITLELALGADICHILPKDAFSSENSNLTEIKLYGNCIMIEDYAFQGHPRLLSIELIDFEFVTIQLNAFKLTPTIDPVRIVFNNSKLIEDQIELGTFDKTLNNIQIDFGANNFDFINDTLYEVNNGVLLRSFNYIGLSETCTSKDKQYVAFRNTRSSKKEFFGYCGKNGKFNWTITTNETIISDALATIKPNLTSNSDFGIPKSTLGPDFGSQKIEDIYLFETSSIITTTLIVFIILVISLICITVILRKHDMMKIAQIQFNLKMEKHRIKYEDIKFVKIISEEGNFGIVYEGTLNGTLNGFEHVDVKIAIKKPKMTQKMTQKMRQNIIKEALIQIELVHERILKPYGITFPSNDIPLIIFPLMANNLKDFLISNNEISCEQMVEFSIQIGQAMTYLSDKKIIHRDLAARNCLLDQNCEIKLADFGLSRKLYSDIYSSKSGNLPTRWMAPESIKYNEFSTKSDVWSYGVVLWEIFTYAKFEPFENFLNEEILKQLKNGIRLFKPECINDNLYDLMNDCWNYDKNKRPDFKDLLKRLDKINEDPKQQITQPYQNRTISPKKQSFVRQVLKRIFVNSLSEEDISETFL